ncbi:MAG: endonuclease/exonuclease/phosphatase family protein [Planctomycetota bacterium]
MASTIYLAAAVKAYFVRLAEAVGLLACLGTALGFLGFLWWPIDLASCFRVQYLVVLLAVGILLAVARRPKASLTALVFALANLAMVAPFCLPPPVPETAGRSATLRAMLVNVNSERGDADRVLALIDEFDPDFVLLEEIDHVWVRRLEKLATSHPHRIVKPRMDNFGIGLFSRLPLASAAIVEIGDAAVPSILARFELSDHSFLFLGTHPPPPASAEYTAWRDGQLAQIPGFLGQEMRPVLLLGDLNVTSWSYPYRKLLKEARLFDSSRGFGVQPTWPVNVPPLLIPIDHCLHSEGIEIEKRIIGPDVGSDHYPVIVDFHLTG